MNLHFKATFFLILGFCYSNVVNAQSTISIVKKVEYTPVKNQAVTGTCWSFSTTSLIESQVIKAGAGQFDLSEMYTVRNIYVEKAKNYLLRQGVAQFGAGGLGHDVISSLASHGAVPEGVYSGLLLGVKAHNHSKLDTRLKLYLDSLLKIRPLPRDWMNGFQDMLDDHLGKVPETFMYREKQYTPQSFAKEVIQFNANDYVNITSFLHHPFYKPFILEVPDNFSNGSYFNIPLNEMLDLARRAIETGYTIMWDADVSNKGFNQNAGYALQYIGNSIPNVMNPDDEEMSYNQAVRQELFENLTTQDDHLMHLVGIERSNEGKRFFLVKNSWGDVGPFNGLIHVSEAYFAINTISLVVAKSALNESLRAKLGFK